MAVEKKTRAKAKKTRKTAKRSEATSQEDVTGVTKIDLGFIGSKDESAESRNVASRARIRSSLDDDIERFLTQGGKIENVEPNVMSDPPRKPESNYGSRPI